MSWCWLQPQKGSVLRDVPDPLEETQIRDTMRVLGGTLKRTVQAKQ